MVRFGAFLAASLFASSAAASPSPESRPEPRKFYGWQVVVTAYSGQALVLHGILSDSVMPIAVGAGAWLFGGVVVHGAHGNVGAAVASPFIEASPLVLALIGSQLGGRRNDEELAGLLFVVGAIAAPLVDGFALGYDRRQETISTSSLHVAPNVARDRLGLSLGGRF